MNLLQIMKTSKDCPTIEFSSPSDKVIKNEEKFKEQDENH